MPSVLTPSRLVARRAAALALVLLAPMLLASCAGDRVQAREAQPLAAGFAPALARALPFAVGVYGMARREPAAFEGAAPNEAERGGADSLPYARVGAGFMVDAEGLVVTAAHVVTDCEQIVVKLADQRVVAAQLVGADTDADIALLRITIAPPAAPPLGRSTALRPGHWVLAVGEPYGLNRSVAAGIVGGKDRHFSDDPELLFIQSDLALNPGNSGGPLLDAGGAIVGMNMRTVVGAYGAPGVSLSIPIEIVLTFVAELRAGGTVVRPRLGAEFDDVSAPLALARGRSTTYGALVSSVRSGSLAARFGLQVDDIVVAMNDRPIAHSADLARALLVWRHPAETRLVVVRGDTLRTLRLD